MSLSEARDFLEHYSYKYTLEAYEISKSKDLNTFDAMLNLRQRYSGISLQWSSALDEFAHQKANQLTIKEQLGLTILNIYRLTHTFVLDVERWNYGDQMVWDKHDATFAQIVELAASVVEGSRHLDSSFSSSSTTSSRTPSPASSPSPPPSYRCNPTTKAQPHRLLFSLDMGIVGPLFDVATRCRDPVIRRKAVAILRSACRQEGVFNSYLSAIVAEHVIQIEENAVSGGGLTSGVDGIHGYLQQDPYTLTPAPTRTPTPSTHSNHTSTVVPVPIYIPIPIPIPITPIPRPESLDEGDGMAGILFTEQQHPLSSLSKIGRASCRERV